MEAQMQALSSLTREHQMISNLIGALQTYANRLREGGRVSIADLPEFAAVFRELVDFRHHEKEEGILLPLLARNGFEWNSGLLAEVSSEHHHLRYLIDVLHQAAAKHEAQESLPSQEDRWQIAGAALAFAELERAHMQKEEDMLFPALQARLSRQALEQLERELTQFDETAGKDPSSARVWQAAEALVARYSREPIASDFQDSEAPIQFYPEARYGT
jgi:hemerythrin-like domain-containing protein